MVIGVAMAAALLLASPSGQDLGSAHQRAVPVGPVAQRVLEIDRRSLPEPVGAAVRSPAPTAAGTQPDDAYYRRLDIHRFASYALLPLFALQYFAGDQLYRKNDGAPDWAKVGHRIGATGIAALFTVNVLTGVPNLIAIRKEPRDRGRRTLHASLMLLASAGFVATGLLAEEAESSPDDRRLHRTVALSSMGAATIGYLTMTDLFRRD